MNILFTCATVARLAEINGVTEETAKQVRAVWKAQNYKQLQDIAPALYEEYDRAHHYAETMRHCKRWIVDRLLQTDGVEYLGRRKRDGRDVYFCNAGDTYKRTVLFIGRRLIVGTWGDLVEAGAIVEADQC